MKAVHDFRAQLDFANDTGHFPFWESIYRQAFPNVVEIIDCSQDRKCQSVGIDRKIVIGIGSHLRFLKIDEKLRKTEYNDFALEYLSNDQTGAKGWIEKDMGIDFIAYAFLQSRTCYLLPYYTLIRAWAAFGAEWKVRAAHREGGFYLIESPNRGYKTLSVAVPKAVLFRAMAEAYFVDSDDLARESKPPENEREYDIAEEIESHLPDDLLTAYQKGVLFDF